MAHPSELIDRPELVKPSILKMPKFKNPLIQATSSNRAPLMTNEIKPKVNMYAGNAMILMTGAIIEFTNPKMSATVK